VHLLDLQQALNGVSVLAHAGHAYSAAAVLPIYRTHCINLSAAISPMLNATTVCQQIQFLALKPLSYLKTFIRTLFSLVKTTLTFHIIKNYVIIGTSWLTEYCRTENQFSSTDFKIFESQMLLCKI